MLHFYASETAALACLTLFVLIFSTLWLFKVGWSREATLVDMFVLVASCVLGCRGTAKGRVCQWPAGVDFTGRVALVVGASSGVGFSTAEQLAEHGWTVILAARNTERLLIAKKRIERRVAACGSKGQAKVLGTVDLRSDASIRAYARELAAVKAQLPIGLLVMAAGALHRHLHFVGEVAELQSGDVSVTASAPSWRATECTVAANAVGPFLLTQLLLPLLDETAERSSVTSRIINVSSSCHGFLGLGRPSAHDPIGMLHGLDKRGAEVALRQRGSAEADEAAPPPAETDQYYLRDFDWLRFVGYYGLSKLCVMWNTRLLAQQVAGMRFQKTSGVRALGMRPPTDTAKTADAPADGERENQLKIFVAATHPGIATTYLYRELLAPRLLDYVFYYPSLVLGKTWFESAQSTLKAAVEDADMVQGGYYLCGGEYGPESGVSCVSAHAQNPTELQQYKDWLMTRVGPALEKAKETAE